jgi:hypothetical protein
MLGCHFKGIPTPQRLLMDNTVFIQLNFVVQTVSSRFLRSMYVLLPHLYVEAASPSSSPQVLLVMGRRLAVTDSGVAGLYR